MKILVTGSAGHLGEALIRTLRNTSHQTLGVDILDSPFTDHVGSIADRAFVSRHMQGVDTVLHTATLHKPHIVTHNYQDFVDTNISGTLNLLEEAKVIGIKSFVFTSTTSTFGHALTPPEGSPAVWVTEDLIPAPKNIYGATKIAAESLCELFHKNHGLPCVVLRTSRFFPEDDDRKATRDAYNQDNAKVNEYLNRRVDISDVVSAHMLAIERAPTIGFSRYIISATTPFSRADLLGLRVNAAQIVEQLAPGYVSEYARRDWKMFPTIDRVYVNERARAELGWRPRFDFDTIISRLQSDHDPISSLAREIGSKGYHTQTFADGPYPVEAETTR